MTPKTYLEGVLETESKPESISFSHDGTMHVLGLIGAVAEVSNQTKRAMFYKKPVDKLVLEEALGIVINSAHKLLSALADGSLADHRGVPPLQFAHLNKRVLHGVLGLSSETGEIAEALVEAWDDEAPLDRVNVSEECGDHTWYLGIIMDEIGVDFPVVFQQNNTKLLDKKAGRYQRGAFDVDGAIKRNLAAERDLLESSLTDDGLKYATGGYVAADAVIQSSDYQPESAPGAEDGTGWKMASSKDTWNIKAGVLSLRGVEITGDAEITPVFVGEPKATLEYDYLKQSFKVTDVKGNVRAIGQGVAINLINAAPYKLDDGELRACITLAAITFRRYEELHRAKGTEESTEKAIVNAAIAGRLEQALAKESLHPEMIPMWLKELDHLATHDRNIYFVPSEQRFVTYDEAGLELSRTPTFVIAQQDLESYSKTL